MRKDIHRLFFSRSLTFVIILIGLKFASIFKLILFGFLAFGLKMFSPFLANDCDLFLHIMLALALGYYHSMIVINLFTIS
jgi:hypothetical protein